METIMLHVQTFRRRGRFGSSCFRRSIHLGSPWATTSLARTLCWTAGMYRVVCGVQYIVASVQNRTGATLRLFSNFSMRWECHENLLKQNKRLSCQPLIWCLSFDPSASKHWSETTQNVISLTTCFWFIKALVLKQGAWTVRKGGGGRLWQRHIVENLFNGKLVVVLLFVFDCEGLGEARVSMTNAKGGAAEKAQEPLH